MRRRCGRGLSSGTTLERMGPESLLPRCSPTFTATSRVGADCAALDQVCQGPTSDGFATDSLNSRASRSRIRTGRESTGFNGTSFFSLPPCGVRGERSSLSRSGWGVSPGRHRRCGPPPPTPQSEPCSSRPARGGELTHHCVFATRGGVAVVTNEVASSIAGPNGVGITRRNGTSTRVPAIGTKAISILRSCARYLITGRSGI